MAYEVKYRSTQNTQNNTTLRLDILEDAYAGSIIEYPAVGISLEYIPSGDDPFEPIYASQLNVQLDVTDDLSNMPDFTTLNDRQYLVKLYIDGVLDWQGWALSDNVQFAFTTGQKVISFNAICGLGMLKNIQFEYLDGFTGSSVTLLQLITNCLRQIEFPTGLDVFVSCNIYATGMGDPSNSPTQPFGQAYTPYTTVIRNDEFQKSIDVLRDILISFGCRIIQAKGYWCILQVNQMQLSNPYFERLNSVGTTQEQGQFSDIKNFTTDLKFIGNSQIKIFRKGYNNIVSENRIVYPENYIFNSTLKENDGTDADGWLRTTSGTGSVALGNIASGKNNTWILNIPNASVDTAQVDITVLPVVAQNDKIKLTWTFYDGIFANVSGAACDMLLVITGPGSSYYLDTDGDWQIVSGPITNYFEVPDADLVTPTEYTFTTPPAPIGGDLSFGLRLNQDTGTNMTVGGFQIEWVSPFKSVTVESRINDTDEYTLEVEFPYGLLNDENVKSSYVGFLSDEDGNAWDGWYMYERKYSQSFRSLTELMVQNYVNQYRANIINVEAIGEGLTDVSARTRFNFDDTDPSQINVNTYSYILGNSTIQYNRNEVSATFLKVSDENVDAEITVTYENDQETTSTVTGRRISSAALTKPDACLLGYGSLIVYFADTSYDIGDVVYTTNTLTSPFNGAMLWWKVEIVELASSRAIRISNSGVIMDVQTC